MEITDKELGKIIDLTEDICNMEGYVDDCFPIAKKRMDLINSIRSRTQPVDPTTDEILYILKKRYRDEPAIQDYIEMIECEVDVIDETKKSIKYRRKDCYNCGTLSCGYIMIDGTGSTTKDAVRHRRKVHNGKRCNRWT